jgi:hypothetical protein
MAWEISSPLFKERDNQAGYVTCRPQPSQKKWFAGEYSEPLSALSEGSDPVAKERAIHAFGSLAMSDSKCKFFLDCRFLPKLPSRFEFIIKPSLMYRLHP